MRHGRMVENGFRFHRARRFSYLSNDDASSVNFCVHRAPSVQGNREKVEWLNDILQSMWPLVVGAV